MPMKLWWLLQLVTPGVPSVHVSLPSSLAGVSRAHLFLHSRPFTIPVLPSYFSPLRMVRFPPPGAVAHPYAALPHTYTKILQYHVDCPSGHTEWATIATEYNGWGPHDCPEWGEETLNVPYKSSILVGPLHLSSFSLTVSSSSTYSASRQIWRTPPAIPLS